MASIRDFSGTNGALWSMLSDRNRIEQQIDRIRQIPPAFVPNTSGNGALGLLSGIASIVAARRREGQLQGELSDNFKQIFDEQNRQADALAAAETRKRQQDWEDWQRRELEKARIESENRPVPTASAADFKMIERPDGVYRVNVLTGAAEKVNGVSGTPPTGGRQDRWSLIERPDGVYRVNPDTGAAQKIGDVPGKPDSGSAPPSGYQFTADGRGLEPIEGGPADRRLTGSDIEKLSKEAASLGTLTGLGQRFKNDFAGGMGFGNLENIAGRVGLPYTTEGQSDWWQEYDRYKNQVRNDLFGSALTPSEQAEWEKADINPNMAAARVKENLALQRRLVEEGLQRRATAFSEQGFNKRAIQAASGIPVQTAPRDATGAAPAGAVDSPARQGPGSSQENPIALTSPDQIRSLPNGTWVRTPDGKVGQR